MADPILTNPLLVAQQAASAQPSRPAPTQDEAAAREAAQEFEAVFLSQMLGHMFAGLPTDGPFGGGPAEATYRSLMINEYGKQIAHAGGIGLADQVMTEILKLQEDPS